MWLKLIIELAEKKIVCEKWMPHNVPAIVVILRCRENLKNTENNSDDVSKSKNININSKKLA